MKRLHGIKFMIIFLIWSSIAFSQIESKNSVVELPDSSTLKSKIIIYSDTDNLQIFTTYNYFIQNCKNYIKKYDIDWDKELLQIIKDNKANVIVSEGLNLTGMNKSRLKFRFASLLENGHCWIYDKKNSILIDQVEIEMYMTKYERGRKFRIRGNSIVLETIDGVF